VTTKSRFQRLAARPTRDRVFVGRTLLAAWVIAGLLDSMDLYGVDRGFGLG
jgi:hypothetical protein